MNVPNVVQGSFSGTGSSEYIKSDGKLLLHLSNTFNGTVKVAFAIPPVGAAAPVFNTLTKDKLGNDIQFTTPYSGPLDVGPKGLLWRLECPTYVSGTIDYKLIG